MCGNLFPLMNYEILASRLETTNSFFFLLLKATDMPRIFSVGKRIRNIKKSVQFYKECK
jgi:hypothetical protein